MTDTELCRLCAESKTKIIGIYGDEGQKIEIERKIAKCLDIQVIASDILPLSICAECCSLLNQYEVFYDKTHQAQLSLRQLFIDIKPITNTCDEPNIDYEEKIIQYASKTESETYQDHDDDDVDDDDDDDDDDEDYTGDSTMHTIYIGENNEQADIEESDLKLSDIMSDEKSPDIKKSQLPQKKKQIKKRKVSRRTKNLSFSGSENDETKIPDNYMTGTESDRELIELKPDDCEKPSKSRGKILDRYPWLCTDCNDKLSSLELLEHHHSVVHNQKAKYMCVQCCKVYEKYNGFLTHVKRHKKDSKYNCNDCGKSFVHKKVLESHKAVHRDDRPHVCTTCGKSFRQQSALCIHSRCHLPEQMKNRYPCDQCGKRFSTKPNLVTHKRIHSGVRNFTCDQCGKSFIQKGNLEAHFLTHSVDKPYSCSLCTKAFKTPLQLKKHETVHTGAKPHQCAVCGRTFREKGTLREHHRIHTGAMPFTCEFCGKCFRFKGILTTHRRQHTGERPYSCNECQHHFTNWPNYNKHMKRRHGINTSHTKHLKQNQALELTNQEDDNGPQSADATTGVQISEITLESSTQPIVIDPVTTTNIQTYESVGGATIQSTFLHEKNGTFFNSVPTSLQTFLTPNVSYFYSVSNTNDNESILPK